ncbi:S-layer homology domain-containing protein [Lutibacter sp. B2]|nr:S-layer homology domain-containing protein [Lutibacter sp. B2]
MKKKILLLTLSLMLISSTVLSYAVGTTNVSSKALIAIFEKAKNHKDKDLILKEMKDDFENADKIDILKGVVEGMLTPEILEKLNENGIKVEDIMDSLDNLKRWSYDSRMKLIEYVENNEMKKAATLIENDGKIEEEKPNTPSVGGGGGALPPKEQPLTKVEPDKKIEDPKKTVCDFKDIETHWAKNSIEHMASIGIVNGIEENKFAPELKVTRSQMVTFIVKLLKIDTKAEGNMPFSDIKPDSWDYGFVKAAYNAKIVNGISAEQFASNNPITREQMIAMIINGLKYKNKEAQENEALDLTKYEDLDKLSDWAKDSMKKAISLGIISGRTEKTIDPQGVATRAEAITIIEKAYSIIHN